MKTNTMNKTEHILSQVKYDDGKSVLEYIKERLETKFRRCVQITYSEIMEEYKDGSVQLWVGWIDNHGLTHGDELYIPNNN